MAKGLFEEMPFDIWTLHSNPASYGPRTLEEVRLRTLIGAAEMLRNGITTIQDFLTLVPQDEAIVDTVLSAYEEAGVRVVFAIAARDRAALDIAPFIPKDLPEAIRKRIAGTDRTASDELDFVAGADQAARHASHGRCRPGRWRRRRRSAARRNCSKASPRCRASTGCRCSPMSMRRGSQAAAAEVQSAPRCSTCWRSAGLMNERLNLVHGVWLTAHDIAQLAEARRARRAQSDQQSQAQERRRADPRSPSGRRRDRARLRQLQLRRDAEHLHRHADAVPAAGGDRSGARIRSTPLMR